MYSKRTQGKGGCLFVIVCTQRDFLSYPVFIDARCRLFIDARCRTRKEEVYCVYSINNDGRHIPTIEDCVSMHAKQKEMCFLLKQSMCVHVCVFV